MLNREIVSEWLTEAIDTLDYAEDPVVPEGIESLDPAECDELLARLTLIARAVRFLQDAGKRRLGDHIGTHGFARFGDRIWRSSPDRKETLRPEKRAEWYRLVSESGLIAEVFPAYAARKGGLRTLAEGYVDVETGEVGWDAFFSEFYDVTEGDVKVTEMPADRAPKFLQALDDGAVEYRGDAA